ncbi:MAG: hypothetical protein HKN90_02895 [Flavobacteriaceae bacterium]|nr:hypothetical protein [Flavobacteriaceae bacterium]
MKNLKFLIHMMVLIFACSDRQDIPHEVNLAFESAFPNAKAIKWEYENDFWEVDFKKNNHRFSAVFDLKGNWVETEYEIHIDELPAIIFDSIKTRFDDYKFKEVEVVESVTGNYYEIELKYIHNEIEVIYDDQGNFIQLKDY